jgi:hypothetical protein
MAGLLRAKLGARGLLKLMDAKFCRNAGLIP